MATADELLAMSEEAANTLVVDINTRIISIPATLTVLGVEADDDIHRLQFSVPRYCGEFDLFEFKAYINYTNARNGGDVYIVDDLAVGSDDTLTFTWLVDRFAFMYPGDVTFSLCMKKFGDEGEIVKEFNTTTAKLPVLKGLETSKAAATATPGALDAVLFRLYAIEAATGNGTGGYYNIIKMEETDESVIFTIESADGTTTAVVKHGKDGEDGHTPVKGEDYYTEADKAEFRSYIDGWAPKKTTVTLTAAGWVDNYQTVTVDGLDQDSLVIPSPEPSIENDNACIENNVKCRNHTDNTLTFSCESVPSVDVVFNIGYFYSSEQTPSQGSVIASDDGNGNVTLL